MMGPGKFHGTGRSSVPSSSPTAGGAEGQPAGAGLEVASLAERAGLGRAGVVAGIGT
jgi:hypothetical protein